MAVFYAMLDIAALNAYVIWTQVHPDRMAKIINFRTATQQKGFLEGTVQGTAVCACHKLCAT